MCKIMIFEPGVMIPYDMLENAVYNNPDGYGLILKDPRYKKLEVRKSKAKKGTIPENDPKEIFKQLEENKDCQRFLHVRHRTEGPIDEDNCHPFTAYYSDKRQVYFMHNGTLTRFRPKSHVTYVNNVRKETLEEEISDSKKFNEEILQPLLLRIKGNIHDDFSLKIVTEFWGTGDNKGLLISNDQDYRLIAPDKWKTMKLEDGVEFLASNDSYFKSVIRGPEYDRRKAAKDREDAEKRRKFHEDNSSSEKWPLTQLKDVDLAKSTALTSSLSNLELDPDFWEEENLAKLANITEGEFIDFCEKHAADAASLLVILTSYYKDLFDRYTRASTHLRNLNVQGKTDMTVEDIEKEARKAA